MNAETNFRVRDKPQRSNLDSSMDGAICHSNHKDSISWVSSVSNKPTGLCVTSFSSHHAFW